MNTANKKEPAPILDMLPVVILGLFQDVKVRKMNPALALAAVATLSVVDILKSNGVKQPTKDQLTAFLKDAEATLEPHDVAKNTLALTALIKKHAVNLEIKKDGI